VKSETEVAQSCPTLSDPTDCSLPGSSIHGIFQARVLEWGDIASPHTHEQFRSSRRALPGWRRVRVASTGLNLDSPWRQNLMTEETSAVAGTYSRLKLV